MLRGFRDIARLCHAARVLARHDALIPRELAASKPAEASLSPGARLAGALESLGPAYIKLGQLLATRPDVIGDETARALAALQDRLPPFPTEMARGEVEAALGAPLSALFGSFDE